uniref:Uncharacterized protein n=1 Tax=Acrobeloides nanus TaxID=290746 RepID=A0A914BYP4_9BILA
MKSFFTILVAFVFVYSIHGHLSIDVSISNYTFTFQQFNCLMNQNYEAFLPQIYSSDGYFSSVGLQNLADARAVINTDVIIAPCRSNCTDKTASGYDQMQSIFEILNAECQPDFIFIQVLSNGKWPNDKQGNRQFILDMIKAVKDNYTDGTGDVARSVGIMTNYNSWSQILGADWTGASNLDLFHVFINLLEMSLLTIAPKEFLLTTIIIQEKDAIVRMPYVTKIIAKMAVVTTNKWLEEKILDLLNDF